MKPYQQALRYHLAHYKRTRLGVSANGLWEQNQKPYPHILPKELKQLNIVETVRSKFWKYFEEERAHGQPISLHRDFHHLTSSQALAFNLFFPWLAITSYRRNALLETLGFANRAVTDWRFEAVVDKAEGTHFDIAIRFGDHTTTFIEVKLQEMEFGVGQSNARRLAKLASIYRPPLSDKVLAPALADEQFFENYQILRNVCYASPKTDVTFLLPKANTSIAEPLTTFLDSSITPSTRKRIRVVFLEQVLNELSEASDPLTRLQGKLLSEKYLVS